MAVSSPSFIPVSDKTGTFGQCFRVKCPLRIECDTSFLLFNFGLSLGKYRNKRSAFSVKVAIYLWLKIMPFNEWGPAGWALGNTARGRGRGSWREAVGNTVGWFNAEVPECAGNWLKSRPVQVNVRLRGVPIRQHRKAVGVQVAIALESR